MKASVFQPEASFCANKWCDNIGQVPASGNEPQVAPCGSFMTMNRERLKTGGITGRGVTPCPYGFLQKIPRGSRVNEPVSTLFPYKGQNFNVLSPSSIFFDPWRPGYLPPTGGPRSLRRVGYEWRN